MRIRLDRLLHYPTARVLQRDGDVTLLRIDGLVCDGICAARSRAALLRLDGVRDVRMDFTSGMARVDGAPQSAQAYASAIDGVVAGKRLRRFIARLHSGPARAAGREAAA